MSELIPISILIPYKRKSEEISLWVQVRNSKDDLNGLLEFPGGKVEGDESPLETVAREVSEEVGIQVDKTKLQRLGNFQFAPLNIFVFLFDDREELFNQGGYKSIHFFKENLKALPPNNKVILEAFFSRFQ